jgi:hypothetical protein
MSGLSDSQSAFVSALREPGQAPPEPIAWHGAQAPLKRFNVYRNNVYAGLIGVLEARYPAVQRLVGEEFFKAMARMFIDQSPPASPVLLQYGGGVPEFLSGFAPLADEPYLADVARLEWAMHRARHAADSAPLRAGDLAALAGHDAANLRLRLASAASLVVSVYPVFSIWRANASPDQCAGPMTFSGAESVLVTRPVLVPEAIRLPEGYTEFIAALLAGERLSTAAGSACTAVPDFALHRAIALLITQKAVVAATVQSHQEQSP